MSPDGFAKAAPSGGAGDSSAWAGGERLRVMQAEISERVKAQYEAFPYPNYNLFLPLRSQEAYASNSLFAARLLDQHGQIPALRQAKSARVLLAGCGDIFPYMATFWEPRRHRLTAVDLSARSLQRARMRCLPRLRGVDWRQGSLEDPGFALPGGLSHIDSYGVLHHLAHPARVLQRFERQLLPGGTARIMVYNRDARNWIHHLQKAFALLGLSAFRREDLDRGRKLLELLAAVSPALRERFEPMRGITFANSARFVDTFFHAREARLGLKFWRDAIDGSGLRMIGVFDRYAELDDLANPLLEVPAQSAWQDRIDDRRFENNLELYLAKPGPPGRETGAGAACRLPALQSLKPPPVSWFGYAETRSIPWLVRRKIWTGFLRGLCKHAPESADPWAGNLPPAALQRLARIGALFPDDFRSRELQDLMRRPLHDSMEPPDFSEPGPVRGNRDIRKAVQEILQERNQPMKYLEAVMRRLDAAQKP